MCCPISPAEARRRHDLKGYRSLIGIGLLAAANLLDYLGVAVPGLEGYGIRLALAVAAVMITLIGGRITPSFTRNWMARLEMQPLPAPMGPIDRVALAAAVAAMVSWVVRPDASLSGFADRR